MKERQLLVLKLKPDCVDEYLHMHANVWPGYHEEQIKGGFSDATCFLHGLNVYVYRVVDRDIYDNLPVDHFKLGKKWSDELEKLLAEPIECGKEFFHLD